MKNRTFAAGDTVTVPTTRYKNGMPRTVRRQAIVRKVDNGIATVVFRTGNRRGLFGSFAVSEMKKARKARNNEYAFGRIVDWGNDDTMEVAS